MTMGVKDAHLEDPVERADPELYEIMTQEKRRQRHWLEMTAPGNFMSLPVLQCLGSCLINTYSEGTPGNRYFGGNEFVDKVELLAQQRTLEAFGLDKNQWGVNVQPYSGSLANLAVYTGLCQPHGRIMGLDLLDGGHLTHGFKTANKKLTASSLFFESCPYKINPETGLIDYDKLAEQARLFRPALIIAGISSYSRCLDYKRFREIADDVGAYLLADMAHVGGLVAAGVIPSPFEFSHLVTTTTHKTLRGPRGAIIFFRKGVKSIDKEGKRTDYDLESKINSAVFPALQGTPHNNVTAAIAISMKEATTTAFKNYQIQVVANARRLCSGLISLGYQVITGGTDVHMVLVDVLKSRNVSGPKAEFILEKVNINCNVTTVPGDGGDFDKIQGEEGGINPSGIRLGTPALTSRGFTEQHIDQVVTFIDSVLSIAVEVQKKSDPGLKDFKKIVLEDAKISHQLLNLKTQIISFAQSFPLPGLSNY